MECLGACLTALGMSEQVRRHSCVVPWQTETTPCITALSPCMTIAAALLGSCLQLTVHPSITAVVQRIEFTRVLVFLSLING